MCAVPVPQAPNDRPQTSPPCSQVRGMGPDHRLVISLQPVSSEDLGFELVTLCVRNRQAPCRHPLEGGTWDLEERRPHLQELPAWFWGRISGTT